MTPDAPYSRTEAAGLAASGLATVVAVVGILVGASTVAAVATLVGLVALWPAIRDGSVRVIPEG